MVITANQAFYSKFNLSSEQTINKSVFNLGNKNWNTPELHNLLENILAANDEYYNYQICFEITSAVKRSFIINAKKISSEKVESRLMVLCFEEEGSHCS